MHIFNDEQLEELRIYRMQPDTKIWKQALDMRGKHSKDPKNIFWTRYNRNIQWDHHVKHGSKIHSKHMSAQDYMQNIQALTSQPLTEATIRIKGNKQSGRQGINDIKERYELSHV